MKTDDENAYRGILLPEDPTCEDLRRIGADYEAMLVSVMSAIAGRYERAPDYPFIDTKLDLITGEDFPTDDPIRGRNAVYGWIQGRGLEAVAGHCLWLRRRGIAPDLLPRLERLMREVFDALRDFRERNGGHLFFFMTPGGQPFILDDGARPEPIVLNGDSPYSVTDLFCSKGMYAASQYFEETDAVANAAEYCRRVNAAIHNRSFVTDQQPLDPKNPVRPQPGCHRHGAYMIQIGAAALMARYEDPAATGMGLRLMQYELTHHTNVDGRIPDLKPCDFWEAIDDDDKPYREDGLILSDPGHALEFVGLALKFTNEVKARNLADASSKAEIVAAETVMPKLLNRNFQNGFQAGPGGICKTFDLLSRKPINTDMPWWNLPETIRAAAFCAGISKTGEERRECLRILSQCHNAFTQHFVRPDLHLMAYQTRAATGEAIPVIPATADADPGYHTGLSLIDVLDTIEQICA